MCVMDLGLNYVKNKKMEIMEMAGRMSVFFKGGGSLWEWRIKIVNVLGEDRKFRFFCEY